MFPEACSYISRSVNSSAKGALLSDCRFVRTLAPTSADVNR